MAGYAKLFSDIVHSTVWRESVYTKVVWITMLAMSDKHGLVMASVPGLADMAKVTLDQCVEAIKILSSPDEYSRTKDYEGRRISEVDGGWLLLNYEKFRLRKDDEEQRIATAERVRKHRAREAAKKSAVTESVTVTDGNAPKLHTDTTTSTDSSSKTIDQVQEGISAPPPPREKVPFEEIVALYHELLPGLPQVQKLTDARKGYIRQRWSQDLQNLNKWRNFFAFVGKSKFLMGKAEGQNGRPPFRADIEWLCKPANFTKIAEDKYHGR